MKILIATQNAHKVQEILQIWNSFPFEVMTLKQLPHYPHVIEDGDSFEANAFKKAREIAAFTGMLTVSDDSGIEVDALNGAPGIYSARYAGEGASDSDNNLKLIHELKDFPPDSDERRGRFRCVAAFVDPSDGFEFSTEGVIEGRILSDLKGRQGFGYDPLFYVPHLEKTTAEMSSEEKNGISHRGQAFLKMKTFLLKKYSSQII